MAAFAFIGFLFPLVFVALIVLIIAALVVGRGDPDTTGRRPYSVYLAVVTFVGLVTALGAAFSFLKALFDWMLVDSAGSACPPGFPDCGAFELQSAGSGATAVFEALLILAAATVLTYLHGRKLIDLRGLEPGSSSAAARVLIAFAYGVAFIAVFGLLASAITAATSLVDVIDSGGDQATSTLLTSVVIGAALGWLLRYAWTTFDLGLKLPTQDPPPPPTTTL